MSEWEWQAPPWPGHAQPVKDGIQVMRDKCLDRTTQQPAICAEHGQHEAWWNVVGAPSHR